MAKSDDVTQQLKNVDGRLTPLETTVKSNKATLDLLPDQINSKVSKQDYTTDQNKLVTRLNNADSERKQLSNSISDKVSLTEYNNGINGVKSYTDNKVNNINVGGRNLFLSYNKDLAGKVAPQITSTGKFTTQNLWATSLYTPNYFRTYLEPNTTYTISYEMTIKNFNGIKTLSGLTFGLLLYDYTERKTIETFTIMALNPTPDTSLIDKKYKLTKTFTTPSDFKNNYHILGYSGGFGDDSSNTRQYVTAEITNLKLEKGTMATDWTPAPEDVNSSIANSSADTLSKANNYTDNKNNEVQKTLTKMNTDISQNGKDIQLRATKEEFNATNKTLSKTVADFTTNVATGMTFTYNENGTIQSMNIGKDGIKLRGDKVDITVNKEFNVVANKVDNKVGKDEVINRLNLSPEGLDIDVNKVGIRGGDSTNYIYLSQDKIEMAGTFQRTFRGNTQKDNVFMRAQGGYLRFRNNNQNRSLYYSDFGISTYIDGDSSEASGTLQFFDYTYSPTNSVRGVTLNSAGGAIALNSERNRIVLDANATVNIESETSSVYIRPMKNNRAGTNEFRFWTKLNDSVADTDGVLSYGTITELVEKAPASYSFGSGIRFDKSPKSRYIYATDKDGNIGTGDFYARNLLGDWWAKNNNLYALVDPKEGKLRITDYNGYNNGSPKYKDLQCDDIQANSVRVNTGQNFYIGVSTNELWVTNNLRYNGGNTGFKPVRASDFIKASSAEFKHDIKKWDYDALNVISNELQLYSYKYNDDEKETIHHGPVIGDGYDIPVEFVFNSGVNTNEMLSWALRAIQQLNKKINTLEEQLNE
ncbi:tail fiber domain-containing protein [Staphylococcus haemolyticus]